MLLECLVGRVVALSVFANESVLMNTPKSLSGWQPHFARSKVPERSSVTATYGALAEVTTRNLGFVTGKCMQI